MIGQPINYAEFLKNGKKNPKGNNLVVKEKQQGILDQNSKNSTIINKT